MAALYVPIFDHCCLTPHYTNGYYVTHTLLHYFLDEYEEEVAQALPEVITSQNRAGLPLRDFLKQNEGEGVINLARIIIRKSLVGSVVNESRCVCEPKTELSVPGNVTYTCVRPPEWAVGEATIECKGCHGTEEVGKFLKR